MTGSRSSGGTGSPVASCVGRRARRQTICGTLQTAVLVGDRDVVICHARPIRLVEVFDMTNDPFGVAAAVITEQCEISGALLRDQYVAVRQNQQTSSDRPDRRNVSR